MYLKDTENILYETPHVRPKLTILRDWYHKSIFPNNNKINKKKKKIPQMWTLNNSLLQHKWVQEKKSQGNFHSKERIFMHHDSASPVTLLW